MQPFLKLNRYFRDIFGRGRLLSLKQTITAYKGVKAELNSQNRAVSWIYLFLSPFGSKLCAVSLSSEYGTSKYQLSPIDRFEEDEIAAFKKLEEKLIVFQEHWLYDTTDSDVWHVQTGYVHLPNVGNVTDESMNY